MSPLVARLLSILLDPTVRDALDKMAATPNRRYLLYYEIAFLGVMLLVKNFEFSRLGRGQFFRRLWATLWTSCLNVIGLSVLVPLIFFGKPYWDLLQAIARFF